MRKIKLKERINCSVFVLVQVELMETNDEKVNEEINVDNCTSCKE